HGTVTAMLFLLVGVIYDRAHHRQIDGFGGLAGIMPVYTGITALAFFAAMGLPGLSAFISEVLVLLGAWQKYPGLTIVAASAVILTAGYMLWTMQRMYLGKPNEKYLGLAEINARELVIRVKERLGYLALFGCGFALLAAIGLRVPFSDKWLVHGLFGWGEGWLYSRMVVVDDFAVFFKIVFCLAAFATVWMSIGSNEI